MTEKERMLSGNLYNPFRSDPGAWERCRSILDVFNSLPYERHGEGMALLRTVLGRLPEDACIMPPFYCDQGSQIYVGRSFYANTGLLILDEARVEIGDYVMIAPRVSIYTAAHPIDAQVRSSGLEYAKGVVIGDHVWIGGNVVINPGVKIGEQTVIGSGSVVTRDIPAHVVAAGNPCRVIRRITEEDARYWRMQQYGYEHDPDISPGTAASENQI